MDQEVYACPAPEAMEDALGGEVSGQATARSYIDVQDDADAFARDRGILCCYTVRYDACGGPLAE